MSDSLGWILLGGGFGFYRAWKRTETSAKRAKKTINSISDADAVIKAEAIGYQRGLRISALLVGTMIYAAVGAVIWGGSDTAS